MEKLTIGKLAEMSGVGVETIRFCQRKELLREPKAIGAFRTYSEDVSCGTSTKASSVKNCC